MSKEAVQAAWIRHKGQLPIIDGQFVNKFEPHVVAAAIEREILRAAEFGWPKISIHMDITDAVLLAQHLRGR